MAFLFHFWAMAYVCFNGDFLPAGTPLFTAGNRSFRYGEGIFETMKVHSGRILLNDLHFDRLFSSLKLLGLHLSEAVTPAFLSSCILGLCERNNCAGAARVRLAISREGAGPAGFVIECWPLPQEAMKWQEEGLNLGLYPHARKSTDTFSRLKTAAFLPYVLAGQWAAGEGLDDALLLNIYGRICDSTKANLFLLQGKELLTPSLDEGCISGVVRRHLLHVCGTLGYKVREGIVSDEDLLNADELLLTNAIQGIRFVSKYKDRTYGSASANAIYHSTLARLYS